MNARKQYDFNGLAGCVVQKKSRVTGTLVGVYNSGQAGLEDDPSCSWATVCEEHNTLICHPSLKLALSHSADPEGWCQFCRSRNNRYVTNDCPEPFTLNEFLRANSEGLGPGDMEDVQKLDVGQELTLGGGAAATTILRRVS